MWMKIAKIYLFHVCCQRSCEYADCFSVLVYDHQTVDTIDFKQNNTNLCLKIGQALKENEIIVYIQLDLESNSLELVVDSNNTLTDLWNIIKRELHMDGERNIFDVHHRFFSLQGMMMNIIYAK